MPFPIRRPFLFVPAPLLFLLCACHGGGGSTHNSHPPLTNIDLAVTNFTVSPSTADPEDTLTVSGTIQNLGTETANPVLGDKFQIGFNLSQDGTVELNEQGFLQKTIDAPIPPGGSLDFSYTAPYGGGDTLSRYADFCTSTDCIPPETGVIGVKVDFTDAIREIDEGNNFQFTPIQVAGTRVAAIFGGCDFGTLSGPDGCDLQISDGFRQVNRHRPSSEPATEVMFYDELQRFVYVSVIIRNCLAAQSQQGSCGGSWEIRATTQKPGLPLLTKIVNIPCRANYDGTPNAINKACSEVIEIRDLTY